MPTTRSMSKHKKEATTNLEGATASNPHSIGSEETNTIDSVTPNSDQSSLNNLSIQSSSNLINPNLNLTNMSISLELAEKMLIKFDGTKSMLFEFIDNCDQAHNLVGVANQPLLLSIIKTKLTHNARTLTRNREFANWKQLKKHLLDLYSDKRTVGQWQLELNSCRQNHNESVVSFSNRVETCYVKLINSLSDNLTEEVRNGNIDLLQNEALNVFITGLNKDLSILVKAQKPDTLEKAISIAINEEQELKSKYEIHKYQSVNNNSSSRFCNYCNKSGHNSFNCRNKNQQHNQNKNFNNVHRIQNHTHINSPSTSNSSKFNRNNFHNNNSSSKIQPRSNNDFQRKFCNYCKNNGHLINECRKLQYNQSRKEQNNNSRIRSSSQSLQNSNGSNLNCPGSSTLAENSRTAHQISAELQH